MGQEIHMRGQFPQSMRYLEKAMSALRALGLELKPDAGSPATVLVEQLSPVDKNRALVIARTLEQSSNFNAVVRQQVEDAGFGQRYEAIAEQLSSIRNDAKRMVERMEGIEGRKPSAGLSRFSRAARYPLLLGSAAAFALINPVTSLVLAGAGAAAFTYADPALKHRVGNLLMRLSRGSVQARFDRVKSTYLDVARSSREQIEREGLILDAYRDYRGGLKEAEIAAHEMKEVALHRVSLARLVLAEAQLKTAPEVAVDAAASARLELERDRCLRELQAAEKRYQIAKDMAENLSLAYNAGEVIVARLQQSTGIKERVYAQAIAFFSANETVFSGLAAAYNSLFGLHEQTQAIRTLKQGMEDGINDLASVGGKVLVEGARTGYDASISPQSIQALVDSVVTFQSQVHQIAEEMRIKSAENIREIQRITEDGKERFVAAIAGSAMPEAISKEG